MSKVSRRLRALWLLCASGLGARSLDEQMPSRGVLQGRCGRQNSPHTRPPKSAAHAVTKICSRCNTFKTDIPVLMKARSPEIESKEWWGNHARQRWQITSGALKERLKRYSGRRTVPESLPSWVRPSRIPNF